MQAPGVVCLAVHSLRWPSLASTCQEGRCAAGGHLERGARASPRLRRPSAWLAEAARGRPSLSGFRKRFMRVRGPGAGERRPCLLESPRPGLKPPSDPGSPWGPRPRGPPVLLLCTPRDRPRPALSSLSCSPPRGSPSAPGALPAPPSGQPAREAGQGAWHSRDRWHL